MDTQMRNKQTGEIKDVERDSSEFRDLQAQVDTGGYPLWEQTSYAHADAIKGRAEAGELDDNDVGAEHAEQLQHAAVVLDNQGVAAEANPHLQLTPGEIEAGMTPQSKLDGLRDMFASGVEHAREAILDEAAKVIAGDKAGKSGRAAAQAKGMRARAGGSDERSGVPVAAHADDPDPAPEAKPDKAKASSGDGA